MDATQRGALMLVRFVAACIMGMGVVELALNWAEHYFRQTPINVPLTAIWIIIFLVGIAVLIKAKAIANWISEKLE